ncbi:MAG: MFS transporter [Roseiarcus sp.]
MLAGRPLGAVAAMFFAFGVGLGAWSGASAAILLRAGVGAAAYGAALTLFTGAYLVAMSSASAFARRFGVKRTLIAAALATGPVLGLLLIAGDAFALFAGLVAYGFFAGLVDLTMNAAGARIERGLGRPILARLHGGASAGIAVGAVSGGLVAASGWPWIASLVVVAALLVASALVASAVPAEPVAGVGALSVDRAGLLSRTLVVVGLVIGVSIACESAAMSWAALILQREAPQWAALSGLGAAFFAACQASLRFNADRLRARIDDRRLIVASLGVAAAGFLVVAAGAGFIVSVVGFAVIGFGTGAVVPCGFALAASRPGVSAAAGLSTAAFFGSFARLPAPLVTGAVADAFSLSSAFALFAGLLAAAIVAMLVFIPSPARAPSS